jgi:hypothetical protein
MKLFQFFTALWHKVQFIANLIYTYVSPIYKELVKIIKEVQDANLENEEARKLVFQKITDFIQAHGLKKIPDSIINLCIEAIFQLIKRGKA